VGERSKLEFFPAGLVAERDRGEDGGFEGGEGAGELVVLDGLEDIGGVVKEKETDGGGAVGGDGAEEKGEVEPRPGPGFPSQILNGDDDGQGGGNRGGGHGGKKEPRPRDQAGGEKQTERRGHGDGGDPGGVHGFPCSGERPVGEGEAG